MKRLALKHVTRLAVPWAGGRDAAVGEGVGVKIG